MKKYVVYVHGKGGNAGEAEHYSRLFEDGEVVGFDYRADTPWEAEAEFREFFEDKKRKYDEITLIANSIGAFFCMNSLDKRLLDRAFFISPIVNMRALIGNMMSWAGVSEDELRERKTIPTQFGETLSWEYLCYVRENPIEWNVPTRILYGENDNLTSIETIREFSQRIGAELTVMEGGEHWFHTPEQMSFLDNWISSEEKNNGVEQ